MNECPKCKKQFKCYADEPEACWCNNSELSKEQLLALGKVYSGCLCPTCLTELSETPSEEITRGE